MHKRQIISFVALLIATVLLPACSDLDASDKAVPIALTKEAVGYHCQMDILDHHGPKGQIHLTGIEQPIFFSQVIDGVAYLRSPEDGIRVRRFFVSDMAKAKDFDHPGADNWIDAADAHFVVGSNVRGGMGAPELVPFGDADSARRFADEMGGKVMRLDAIPDHLIFGTAPPA